MSAVESDTGEGRRIFEVGGDFRTSSQEIARIFADSKNRKIQLTWSIDTEYFWGRAGFFRILALICSTTAFICGLPGFKSADPKLMGYGDTSLIYCAISCNGLAILISMLWLLGLLLFREIRYEEFWDEANMRFHVLCCGLCLIAGFSEVFGMYNIRINNCPDCPREYTQYNRRADTTPNTYRPDYWQYHNASFMLKIAAGILFSFCSRVYLKNED